jgi:hypothetical protein
MSLIKLFLCSGICMFCFTALIAQLPLQENKNINNVIHQHVYQQKRWNIKQVLKDSVLYKYESYLDHSDKHLTISPLSIIYISFNEQSPIPHLSTSERIQPEIQTTQLRSSNSYLSSHRRCWIWDNSWYRSPLGDCFQIATSLLNSDLQ